MSVQVLDIIKEQVATLPKQEQLILARYILEQSAQTETENSSDEKDIRIRQLEWLKANRDEYAGEYVALDGDNLVGHGVSIREVREQAKQKNVKNPFIIKIFSEDTTVSAGL